MTDIANVKPRATSVGTFTYFDLETTGTNTRHDVPIHFAALVTDSHGNEISRTELKSRPPRNVLLAPGALVVTRQSPKDIYSRPMSHAEFMLKMHAFLAAQAPTTFASFNGLRFDEEMVRHSAYATLQQPYVTQFNGSKRIDIMRLVQAVAALNPSTFIVPKGQNGKGTFKLEPLAAANGFHGHNAHDAMGDVLATQHLHAEAAMREPSLYSEAERWISKGEMSDLMHLGAPVIQVDWSYPKDGPIVRLILPITQDTENPNEWWCADLDANVDKILSMNVEQLKRAIAGYKHGIRSVKCNAMPLLLPLSAAPNVGLGDLWSPSHQLAAQRLKSDTGLADRLAQAAELRKAEYAPPAHVREQLYSGGFFPWSQDAALCRAFHQAAPAAKWGIAQSFKDPRARELARQLIGAEWPLAMPEPERLAYEDELRQHLMIDTADWMTVPRAFREIDEALPDADVLGTKILLEYREYLEDRFQ